MTDNEVERDAVLSQGVVEESTVEFERLIRWLVQHGHSYQEACECIAFMAGTPHSMDITVRYMWDSDDDVWRATCDDPVLALESDTLDILMGRVMPAVRRLLESSGCADISFASSEYTQTIHCYYRAAE